MDGLSSLWSKVMVKYLSFKLGLTEKLGARGAVIVLWGLGLFIVFLLWFFLGGLLVSLVKLVLICWLVSLVLKPESVGRFKQWFKRE